MNKYKAKVENTYGSARITTFEANNMLDAITQVRASYPNRDMKVTIVALDRLDAQHCPFCKERLSEDMHVCY